jgi:hypothetical protein
MQNLLDLTGEPWPPAAAKLSTDPKLRPLSAIELYKVPYRTQASSYMSLK